MHSAYSAKLHHSIGSIIIRYISFLVFWEKTYLPHQDSHLSDLQK